MVTPEGQWLVISVGGDWPGLECEGDLPAEGPETQVMGAVQLW